MILCSMHLIQYDIENSSIVKTLAHNGFEIRVSSLKGNTCFTGPVQKVIRPMFASYKPEDSSLNIGDRAITETYGIDGFAVATAPAIVPLVGGTVEEARKHSTETLEMTTTENPNVTTLLLDFMGVPTGINVRKVIVTGKPPIINTAIAHKDQGIGMIGAGITNPPFEAVEKAIKALDKTMN